MRITLHYLRPGSADVIMDLGCGKGRAICFFAAERRVKRVIGVELYKGLYEAAVKNINNLKIQMTKINIYHTDAVNFTDIDDVTIFVIYNPFGENTLTNVIKNIEKSLKVNPRAIQIVYYPTPNHARLFDETPWLFFKKRVTIFMAISPIYFYSNQKD
jgi:precorrin-6B methylase 2